jgi:hypothetical protein
VSKNLILFAVRFGMPADWVSDCRCWAPWPPPRGAGFAPRRAVAEGTHQGVVKAAVAMPHGAIDPILVNDSGSYQLIFPRQISAIQTGSIAVAGRKSTLGCGIMITVSSRLPVF